MPATIRETLRERRNVHLRVKTSIPNDVYDDYSLSSESPAPSSRRGRGRSITRKKLAKSQSQSTSQLNESVPRLYPIHTPRMRDEGLSSLHRLVPYIYLALHRGQYLPRSIIATDGSLFTHVVKMVHADGGWEAGDIDLQVDGKHGLMVLGLVVPSLKDLYEEERTKTVLSEQQLQVARDFLALALPYYAEAHGLVNVPSYGSASGGDGMRVLITAPEGHSAAADVMSIAACYLAWASEQSVESVLQHIKMEEEILGIWREAVKEKQGISILERVARLE